MYNDCPDMTCLSSMQMWAFKAIPFLGSISARRLEGMRFPRLLNWGYKEGIPSLEKITAASKDEQVRKVKNFITFIFKFERSTTQS